MEIKGLHVLVVGLGISGRSAVRFLLSRGASVLGVDSNRKILKQNPSIKELCCQGLTTAHDSKRINMKEIDLVVVSPGVPLAHPRLVAAQEAGVEVIGEAELASRFFVGPCVGITGTNGKTTVTLLTAHVLNRCGKRARAAGNVGTPLTAELDHQETIIAELSSYQLETMRSQVLDMAVVLNITPDHLDRYASMKEYAQTKLNIKNCLKAKGKFLIGDRAYQKYEELLEGALVQTYGFDPACDFFIDKECVKHKGRSVLKLPKQVWGKQSYEVENQVASYLVCREFGVTAAHFLEACASFQKPPHRVEFVKEIGGVSYYNDSKGTNIDAVVQAVRALGEEANQIVLIAGGVDKGSSYAPWLKAFEGKVSRVCTIGEAAKKIQEELSAEVSVTTHRTLKGAVTAASKSAKPGDIVLLSPGCSSFDMFRDYQQRGEEFKRLICGEKK